MVLPSPFASKPETKSPKKNFNQNQSNSVHKHRNNFRNHQKKFQFQKFQQENREQELSCTYCKIKLNSNDELYVHRRSHEKCPFDGCKFNANAETVAIHIQKLHVKKEFFAKIQNLTTPEEIEKWREERRKRYPTTENVLLRQKAQEIRKERGEKLTDRKSRFGDKKKLPRQNKSHPQKSKNKRKFENNKSQEKTVAPNNQEVKVETPENESDDDEPPRKIPKFTGTSKLPDYHSIEVSIKQKSALSVLGMYGSESEPEEDEAQEKDKVDPPEETKIEEEIYESTAEDLPEEIPVVREDVNDNQPKEEEKAGPSNTSPNKRQRNQNKSENPQEYRKPKSLVKYSNLRKTKNEFLEKLLQDDIRHERNVLLQCVRYVVQNNFFDKPAETPKSEEPEINDEVQVPNTSESSL